jgi:alkylation response protein AidB-like acyl-CoA dehydrogenase
MDFSLSEEHLAVKEAARHFAQQELLPDIIERDEKQIFPHEQVKMMGELGFLGMMTDPAYNGSGMDMISYVLALEEISKIDAAAAVIMSVNNSLVCWELEEYGSDIIKDRYLKKLASGEALGALCLSEPDAGSDATAIKTKAVINGDHYLLNGVKNWVTNGGQASIYVVIAQSDSNLGYKGINAFVVEASWDGVQVGPKENKLGIRSSGTHSIMFNDVKIPLANRLGNEGTGFKIAMNTLNGGRIGIAAQALGIASGAFDLALKYSRERRTFGKLLSEHQAIQFKLANMASSIEASRLLCYKAAWLKDRGLPYIRESAIAKLISSQTAMDVANEAIQIHGGYGYVKEYHVERMLRDAKITQIYEGTSEIQQIIIARDILRSI